MTSDAEVVKSAVQITSILSKHLNNGECPCPHCKKLFKEIFE